MNGFFVVPRGLMQNPVFRNEPCTDREAFLWMVEAAAFCPRAYRLGDHVFNLQRGQLVASYRFLADRWGWSKDRVSRFISRCEKSATLIRTEPATGGTVITICEYDKMQDMAFESTTPSATTTRTPPRHHRDKTEINIKEGKEGSEDSRTSADLQKAVDAWNGMAARCGLSVVQKLTDARKKHLAARLRDCGGLEGWSAALAKVEGSGFLLGRSGGNWKADFDFLLGETKFTKVMEGAYDDNPGNRDKGGNGFAAMLDDQHGEHRGFAAACARVAARHTNDGCD